MCPTCSKETPYEGNPHRPFCSERCRMADLGRWATGSYRIPVADADEDEDGTQAPGENREER
jgi:uncharacterized protein